MHGRPLFGIETEYAIAAFGRGGDVVPTEQIADRMIARAVEVVPHVHGTGDPGLFLPNGSRFHLDTGVHPEYAAAECTDPWEAVRAVKAGDALLSALADEVCRADGRVADLLVTKCNVDYSDEGRSWGSHESYLHYERPDRLRTRLIPHLVTRAVFAGAGGFDPRAAGAAFLLSPRAAFVTSEISHAVTGARGIVDERDQPLGEGSYRQHISCGESLQSDLSAVLRVGTTALVTALLDAGLFRTESTALASPLTALATVASDVTLRATLLLRNGGLATAIGIQRRYLDCARANLRHPVMPGWSAALCDVWDDTLTRLERGAEAVADRLDWAIKFAMFRRIAARRGIDWDDERGRSSLRAMLCEIDVRFGDIGGRGPFAELKRRGLLHQLVNAVDGVERAMSAPPREGRGRVRGDAIRDLIARGEQGAASWTQVLNLGRHERLDLGDPLADTAKWRPDPTYRPGRPAHVPVDSYALERNNRAVECRRHGRLTEAEHLLREALAIEIRRFGEQYVKISHRLNNLAIVVAMQGRLDEAGRLLTRAWRGRAGRHDLTSGRILAVRLALATIRREATNQFIGQLKAHLSTGPHPDHAEVSPIWDVQPFLDAIAPRLRPEDLRFLAGVAAALDAGHDEPLRQLPLWRGAASQSLHVPWPEDS